MDEHYLSIFKIQMEESLRNIITETIEESQDLPEFTHGIMVMSVAGTFIKEIKDNYLELKNEFENSGKDIGLTQLEYNKIIDDTTSKVISEFIDLPNNQSYEEEIDY